MKVAYVTQPYDGVLPPRQNSIGLIVYNTALEVARSAQVTLYLRPVDGSTPTENLPFGFAFTRSLSDELLQSLASRYPRWTRRLGLAERADSYLGWAGAVAGGLRRASVDVVHVMNYWGWSKRLRGNRLVLEMQSEWLSQMNHDVVAEQLRGVHAVVAVSGHVERLFRAAFPDYQGVVAVVHNGVDIDLFCPYPGAKPRDDNQRILFVGRLSPEKGVHTLLQAFADVVERFPRVRLDLVGPRTELPRRFLIGISDDPLVRALGRFYQPDGSSNYQQQLDALVREAGLERRVTFHGSLPHRDIVGLYQMADIVVNPSLSETFGISIVEGMACGVPVVGTRVGGMLDTIDDGVGRAVAPEDPVALTGAICAILEDRGLAGAMGECGRKRAVTHFTWSARAERLLDVYRRVCDAN
ncbi:MAG: glycosyltransferase family 4 protein [Dechloromonas sp.]|nr:glycosyltransferase family 4 protein [Candidatus Dechloromonas phosphoritropha]MBP8788252.1 glycosyltransferase family 4 protein [Azonexus sp.]